MHLCVHLLDMDIKVPRISNYKYKYFNNFIYILLHAMYNNWLDTPNIKQNKHLLTQ